LVEIVGVSITVISGIIALIKILFIGVNIIELLERVVFHKSVIVEELVV
jgi:hypothetical protein